MVSVDEEDVPFSTIIYPADAKGMVSYTIYDLLLVYTPILNNNTRYIFSYLLFGHLIYIKVEKWLLQVEKQMTQSLKDIIQKAVPEYYEAEFGAWITKWPGQVVLVCKI